MKRDRRRSNCFPEPGGGGRRVIVDARLRCFLRRHLLLTGAFLAFVASPPSYASAQSTFAGEIEGRVTDRAGRLVRGASVSLTESGGGRALSDRTGNEGTFRFAYTPGGVYDVRVEALGYRPIFVSEISVAPGERIFLPISLIAEPPPVLRQDTVNWGRSAIDTPTLGFHAGELELEAFPDRDRDVGSLLAGVAWSDGYGGVLGLPPEQTMLFSEGELHRTTGHPALKGALIPTGLSFPRVGLRSLTAMTGLEDIEWSGNLGGIVRAESRGAVPRFTGELFGLWSGGGLWESGEVDESQSLLSAWGGTSVSIPLPQSTPPLTFSFEGGVVETPNLYSRNDSITSQVLPDAPAPGIRKLAYGSGSARFDVTFRNQGRGTIRAGFSSFKNESDRLGVPQAGYASELPVEGSEGSVSAVFARPFTPNLLLEVRGSGGLNSRKWEAGAASLPGAYLAGEGALLGTNPFFPASVDRVELSLTPMVHYRWGDDRLKGGFRVEYGSFDMTYLDGSPGSFFFGSPDALVAGEGAAILLSPPPRSRDFYEVRTSVFGQYLWTALPGLDITLGLAWNQEHLPLEDTSPSERWEELSGLSNVRDDQALRTLDGRVHLQWDVQGDGETWLLGGLGVEHGALDPWAMHEVLTLDGTVLAERALGGDLNWEEGTAGGSEVVQAGRLSMFGSDPEAPVTTSAALGLFRTLGDGVRAGLMMNFRRTESILRRTDLNRLLEPVGTDQDGRPVYGDLRIVSGILSPDPATYRRFPEFESVWSLNSDGWSEYRGLTASLEAPLGDWGSFAVQYTYSRTRDNWIGASKGGALARLDPGLPVQDWDESVSDFDVPHRLSALVVLPLPLPGESYVSGLYTLRSDFPFTPRIASGLDANGDGSPFNDIAFVPGGGPDIQALAGEWDCLSGALGGFAERNACRGDPLHTLNLRLAVGLPRFGGVTSALVIDGLNLTDNQTGIRDENLLLLGGDGVTQASGEVTVPYRVNPEFGSWVSRGDRGRMLRVGLRVGGGQ